MTTWTGTSGNDTLPPLGTYNGGNDILNGLAGNDRLFGGAGSDQLDGGTGADQMSGGTGDDQYWVDNTGDIPSELLNEGRDTVNSNIDYTLRANIEDLYTTASIGIGNDLNNYMAGLLYANKTFYGLGGNDVIVAGVGNDTIEGGQGADTIDGAFGTDTASYAASGAAVSVHLGYAPSFGGDAAGDTLSSIENLTGSAYDDYFSGDSGSNVISGGTGRDHINGMGGNDTLTGGLGADDLSGDYPGMLYFDTFDYNSVDESNIANGVDDILDFQANYDKIDLSDIDANTQAIGDQPWTFNANHGTATIGQVTYEIINRDTYNIYAENNGAPGWDLIITLENNGNLGSNGMSPFDFIL